VGHGIVSVFIRALNKYPHIIWYQFVSSAYQLHIKSHCVLSIFLLTGYGSNVLHTRFVICENVNVNVKGERISKAKFDIIGMNPVVWGIGLEATEQKHE